MSSWTKTPPTNASLERRNQNVESSRYEVHGFDSTCSQKKVAKVLVEVEAASADDSCGRVVCACRRIASERNVNSNSDVSRQYLFVASSTSSIGSFGSRKVLRVT